MTEGGRTEAAIGGDRLGGNAMRGGGAQGGSPATKGCVYTKGGTCSRHGPGAKLHWKPVKVRNPAPGGKKTTKQYYYTCDIGPKGGALRQPRLSFRAKLEEDNPRIEDNNTQTISTTTPSLGK